MTQQERFKKHCNRKKIVPIVTTAVVCVAVGCAFLFGKPVVKWAEEIVNDYEGRNASDNQQSDTLLAGQSMSDEKSVTQQKSERQNSRLHRRIVQALPQAWLSLYIRMIRGWLMSRH